MLSTSLSSSHGSPGATPNTNISGTQWASSYWHLVFSKATPWAHCCIHLFLRTPSPSHYVSLYSPTSGIWMMVSCRDQGQHCQGQWTLYRETAPYICEYVNFKKCQLLSKQDLTMFHPEILHCSTLQILRFLVLPLTAMISALPSSKRSGR